MLVAFSCNNIKEPLNMKGVYTMLSQTINDGTKDSSYSHVKQLKIYTDNYMMYANVNTVDSTAAFGIGSYSIDTGKLAEYVIYSASNDSIDNDPSTFILEIEKTTKGYKQVIADIPMSGKKYKLTEEYDSAGNGVKSPLDGAWKQTENYTIRENDTTNNTMTEYKVYYGGHFIFGITAKDSATNKTRAGSGYGTFEMNGNNKVKEMVKNSNYSLILGRTFDIDIELYGSDKYKQTITGSDGAKFVEVYKRLGN